MRDFLGHDLKIGDDVIWRGELTHQPGLIKSKVVRFTTQRVIIELPNYSWEISTSGPTRETAVDPVNLVRLRDAL